jgi:NAD(P)-dependent dehydrogenase (short-subunit alcohol dehydrogenase family)
MESRRYPAAAIGRVAPRRFRDRGTSQRVGGLRRLLEEQTGGVAAYETRLGDHHHEFCRRYNPDKRIIDYAANKRAIMIFNKGLAKQLAQKGIRVNSVAPGPIWTPLQPSGGQFLDKLPEFGADTPMGRPGQPAELAPIYVLLATNEDSYSTGQVYGAVGGNGGP